MRGETVEREVIALIEWTAADVESRVYTVLQEPDGVCVCSDQFFVGRWQTLDEVRIFIRDYMRGEIVEELAT